VHYSSEAPSHLVLVDETAIVQVFDNILSNAVKYSPHGKNVFVRIRHSSLVVGHSPNDSRTAPMTNAPMTNNFIRVEVQDEGEGISPDDMTKLFGKFARLSARPTGGEHSTGLGLSIVKKMVEAMNGRVWCESELGKGATFIVELPKST
jgi:signal transduction histidine kinase